MEPLGSYSFVARYNLVCSNTLYHFNRSLPQFSLEIAELCKKYKHRGVVAIDIAGDENMVETTEPTQPEHFTAFEVNEISNT